MKVAYAMWSFMDVVRLAKSIWLHSHWGTLHFKSFVWLPFGCSVVKWSRYKTPHNTGKMTIQHFNEFGLNVIISCLESKLNRLKQKWITAHNFFVCVFVFWDFWNFYSNCSTRENCQTVFGIGDMKLVYYIPTIFFKKNCDLGHYCSICKNKNVYFLKNIT